MGKDFLKRENGGGCDDYDLDKGEKISSNSTFFALDTDCYFLEFASPKLALSVKIS